MKENISTIVSTTIRTIENLNKYKAWWDALILYFKYRYHSEIQWTNQPRANNEFMIKWLWRWKDRLQTARKILFTEWLIEEIQWQNKDWTFNKKYIKINYIPHQTRNPSDRRRGSPSDGEPATNALSVNNLNAWSVNNLNTCKTKKRKPMIAIKKYEEFVDKLSEHIAKLKEEYPKKNIEIEMQRCWNWNESKGREIKKALATLKNWLLPKKWEKEYSENIVPKTRQEWVMEFDRLRPGGSKVFMEKYSREKYHEVKQDWVLRHVWWYMPT